MTTRCEFRQRSKLSKLWIYQATCLKRMTGFLGVVTAGIIASRGKAPKIHQIKNTPTLRTLRVANLSVMILRDSVVRLEKVSGKKVPQKRVRMVSTNKQDPFPKRMQLLLSITWRKGKLARKSHKMNSRIPTLARKPAIISFKKSNTPFLSRRKLMPKKKSLKRFYKPSRRDSQNFWQVLWSNAPK